LARRFKTDNQAPCIFFGSIENKDGFLAYTPGAEVSIDMSLVVSSTTPAASGTALSTPAVALAAAPWSIGRKHFEYILRDIWRWQNK
jgi:hypothetical protein